MEQRSFSVSVSEGKPGSRVAVSLIGLICPSCMSRYDFSTLTLQTVQNGPGGGMRGLSVALCGYGGYRRRLGPRGEPLCPLTQC